jgi:putative transposase
MKNTAPLEAGGIIVTGRTLEDFKLWQKNQNAPSLPSYQDKIANYRCAFIKALREEISQNPQLKKGKVIRKFIKDFKLGILLPNISKELKHVSRATIYRDLKSYEKGGTEALKRQYHGPKSSEPTDHEKNILLALLLHQHRLKIGFGIELAKEYLKKKGFESPSSPRKLRRFIDQFKKEHSDIWVLKREGEKAHNDKVMPYAERDPFLLEVGEGLVADGHRLNFQVVHPITGKPARAALVLFWDWRSSYPLGWEIMFEENIQCVASALRNAILALGKYPKWVYLDNGKSFRAKIFTEDINFEDSELPGMFGRLKGVNYHFAQPYNAQAKPIERIFGIMNEQLERLIPSYIGASIEDKPAWTKRNEKLARFLHNPKIPTISEACEYVHAWRDRYAEQPTRGRNGLRPIDIFNEGKGPGVDPRELDYLMMDGVERTVQRNGIEWLGWHWYDEVLYGLKDKVLIKYSLFDLSQVYIFYKNDFICTAKPIEKVHPMASESENPKDIEAVKEIQRLKNKVKNTTKKLTNLLDTKAAGEIDWSKSKTPEIAETIQKIEEKRKPKVINISPFAGAPEPELPVEDENQPLHFSSASERYEFHLKGGIFLGPKMDNKFIEDYRSGEIAPGEWEAIYKETEEGRDERKVCHH